MKDNIFCFYNRNCVVDDNKHVIVSIRNNLFYLECTEYNGNRIKVKVSSYKSIIKILSILGYEMIK